MSSRLTKALAGRVSLLNKKAANSAGRYVLYWVQASPRTSQNAALELACQRANEAGVPLAAVFALSAHYDPNANLRHYAFMLEGLAELDGALREERGVGLSVVVTGKGGMAEALGALAEEAVEVVVDRGYLRVQRQWYAEVAEALPCRLSQVEANVVVPVELASPKEEFAARTIRKKIWNHAPGLLKPMEVVELERQEADVELSGSVELADVGSEKLRLALLERLDVDDSVQPNPAFRGGYSEAKKRLDHFVEHRLKKFDSDRNFPGKTASSDLSPYLHFGHIGPVECILAVNEAKAAPKAARDSFVEELMVRRELAVNFVWYNDHYDSLKCLPDWCLKTIREHRSDRREYIYTSEELEEGKTHDEYWNACQLEMVTSGKMHGYMRMYWAKKVMEWTPSVEEAFGLLVHLNDKYELDGRDPNGFAGIAWCFGKHDTGWTERAIFGKLRYMNSDGLRRKFRPSLDVYVHTTHKAAGRKKGNEGRWGAEARKRAKELYAKSPKKSPSPSPGKGGKKSPAPQPSASSSTESPPRKKAKTAKGKVKEESSEETSTASSKVSKSASSKSKSVTTTSSKSKTSSTTSSVRKLDSSSDSDE